MLLTDTPAPDFADLGLAEPVLRAVADSGYTQPTEIQARAIPLVLAGRDVVGIAQTGTGKTASFVLPMLTILASGRARARMPRSLILSPTRELATQTSANFEIYGKHLNLSMALLIGGVGMGDQEKALEKGVDVLIATPGRLLDWFERGKVMLGGVQILVIDEADRMLDMGFIPDVERIISLLTRRGQTLLFSATMLPAVRRLAERFLTNPETVEVARSTTSAELIDAALVPIAGEDKRRALLRLVKEQEIGKAIVFCNRKRDVSALNRFLQGRGLNARDIHGDLEQVHRQATLDAFKAGEVDFLIATDVAARGLDISDMPNVVNYDVPFNPEDYVHRIGRTGRAGKSGRAFTFATPEEAKLVIAIEKLTGKQIPRLELQGEHGASAAVPAVGEQAAAEAPRPARARTPRTRRAAQPKTTTEAVAAEAVVEQPAPEAAVVEQPVTVEGQESAAEPQRRRRRKPAAAGTATPEAVADDVVAAPSSDAAPAPEAAPVAPAPAPEAATPEAPPRKRAAAAKRKAAAPREAAPAMRRDPVRQSSPGEAERQPRRDQQQRVAAGPAPLPAESAPMLAFGGHVPSFMLRPVPLVGRAKADAEDLEDVEAEAA
ncbi:MAG TPA: DEAD/DEAH box helicase [Geminicoccaceae bacterium]